MANEEHLNIIRQGVDEWNEWREKHTEIEHPDLREADLKGAHLSGAHLDGALLVSTDLRGASLSGSNVYGASVWDIKVDDQTKQQNLVITPHDQAAITVDNIEVAQFIYVLLNNQQIRKVIDTITSKPVLILGRFSEEQKPILDGIREKLRKHNYLPILFDFTPSLNRPPLDTIKILAGMAKFVIADLTDARSVNQEVDYIVENLPSVAVRFIRMKSASEYGMRNSDVLRLSVVEGTYEYDNREEAIASTEAEIITPAEAKVEELRRRLMTIQKRQF